MLRFTTKFIENVHGKMIHLFNLSHMPFPSSQYSFFHPFSIELTIGATLTACVCHDHYVSAFLVTFFIVIVITVRALDRFLIFVLRQLSFGAFLVQKRIQQHLAKETYPRVNLTYVICSERICRRFLIKILWMSHPLHVVGPIVSW